MPAVGNVVLRDLADCWRWLALGEKSRNCACNRSFKTYNSRAVNAYLLLAARFESNLLYQSYEGAIPEWQSMSSLNRVSEPKTPRA
jgi:hypothetical protein